MAFPGPHGPETGYDPKDSVFDRDVGQPLLLDQPGCTMRTAHLNPLSHHASPSNLTPSS